MSEHWIGEKVNTSESYYKTNFEKLKIRGGGPIDAKRLYRFNCDITGSYYISDPKILDQIETYLYDGYYDVLNAYIYKVIIDHLGIDEFLNNINNVIQESFERGFDSGKLRMQKDFRMLLGLG